MVQETGESEGDAGKWRQERIIPNPVRVSAVGTVMRLPPGNERLSPLAEAPRRYYCQVIRVS